MHTQRFFVLLLAASAAPAMAQSRVEVSARRASQGDTMERQLRPLKRQLDSLTQLYNESDDLSSADRRRVADELGKTIQRMTELSARLGSQFMVRVAPSGEAGFAGGRMSGSMFEMVTQTQAMPKGYLGFVAVGPAVPSRIEQGEYIVRYLSYPRIVSVDPSSPAQRAGIVRDDTLLAYDGRDVRDNDISLTRLLKPNARVMVRLRHDGKVRDVPVLVAEAPQRIVIRRDDEARDSRELASMLAPFPRVPSMPAAPSSGGTNVGVFMRSPVAPTAVAAPSMPAMAGRGSYSISWSNGVAGAQMNTMSEGLSKLTGVDAGVFVSAVPVGSPASESGLTDGDVIVRVAGRAVQDVAQLRQLVRTASDNGEHSVDVDIVRERKSQKITLRW